MEGKTVDEKKCVCGRGSVKNGVMCDYCIDVAKRAQLPLDIPIYKECYICKILMLYGDDGSICEQCSIPSQLPYMIPGATHPLDFDLKERQEKQELDDEIEEPPCKKRMLNKL